MKLSDGEKQISKYFFKGLPEDHNNMSILTDRRLIVIYRNGEESYPLTKITSVKYYEYYEWWKLILGGIISIWGIILLLGVVAQIFTKVESGVSVIFIMIAEIIFAYIVGYLLLIKSGLRKKTKLIIGQMGGTKKYTVKKSEALTDFIDEINKKLQ